MSALVIQEFRDLLERAWPGLPSDARARVERYYELILRENERQNLTRLVSPTDFIEGHVLDVKELLESNLVDFPAMDLGSGGGVPGLLAATIREDRWILAESERRKAEFLFQAARELQLTSVRIVADRAESYLSQEAVRSVVARAVGPVERIYSWLHGCSTWNNLVLLKGPAWDSEWGAFQAGRYRGRLSLKRAHSYTVGAEQKKRIIVRLERVPRGT